MSSGTDSKEVITTSAELNTNIQCCNCAKSGHFYEDCPQKYWSSYSPTSLLVKNYEDVSVNNLNQSSSSQVIGENNLFYRRNALKRSPPSDEADNRKTSAKLRKLNEFNNENSKQGSRNTLMNFLNFSNPFGCFQPVYQRKRKSRRKKRRAASEGHNQ